MTTKLANCNLITNGRRILNQEVVIAEDRIIYVGNANSYPSDCDLVDLGGRWLAPGFIDLQVNGAGGALFQERPTGPVLDTMSQTLRRFGVTNFLPTLTATTPLRIANALAVVSQHIVENPHNVLGLNLEGPFINPKKAGMAAEQHIGRYYEEFLQQIATFRRGALYMTVAPEAVDPTALNKLAEAGIVLSIGHTNATFDEARKVFDHSVKVATHIFNAMTGISGRDPGVVGAVLDRMDIAASFIADGFHVHASNARFVYRLLGPNRLFLISDGMPTLGSDTKEFTYAGHRVTDVNGKCTTQDGVLAGTGIDIAQDCRNMASWLAVDVAEVVPMITATPARVLGVDNEYGSIRSGCVANLVLTDPSLAIDKVILRGDLSELC